MTKSQNKFIFLFALSGRKKLLDYPIFTLLNKPQNLLYRFLFYIYDCCYRSIFQYNPSLIKAFFVTTTVWIDSRKILPGGNKKRGLLPQNQSAERLTKYYNPAPLALAIKPIASRGEKIYGCARARDKIHRKICFRVVLTRSSANFIIQSRR